MEILTRDAAVQFSGASFTQDDHIQWLATGRQGQIDAARQGHHHKENCHG
jgi:hypothetical protein